MLAGLILATAAVSITAASEKGEKANVQQEAPKPEVAIKSWDIRWGRFEKLLLLEAGLVNTTTKAVTNVEVKLKLFGDAGEVVHESLPKYVGTLYPGTTRKVKMKFSCPYFSRYRFIVRGRMEGEKEDKQWIFWGRYWPTKPGETPQPPGYVVYARGAADVRVIGSSEQVIRRIRGRDALQIRGTVQNFGDKPAEHVTVVVTFMDGAGKKTYEDRIKLEGATIEPGAKKNFSRLYNTAPTYRRILYDVKFDTVGGVESPQAVQAAPATAVEKIEMTVGPLKFEDCTLDYNKGLIKGKIVNTGAKTVEKVVITLTVNKGKKKKTFRIEPGGSIAPRKQVSFIKALVPGMDGFSINVEYKEKKG